MKLRWLLRKYPTPSSQEIGGLLSPLAVAAAKQALKTPDEKVLQVFDGKDWIDVPTVTEIMQEDPKNTL